MDNNTICELAKASLRQNYTFKCTNIVGYIRVSSRKQSEYSEGHISLEAQKSFIEEFLRSKSYYQPITWVEEVVSARNMDKQVKLKKILKHLTPGTIIVSYDISRFSRSVRGGVNYLHEVYKKGGQYWFAYEKIHYLGTASKLVIHNSLTHAEGESDKTSDRVKFANAYLRIRGDYRGREAPFGYRICRDPRTNIRKLAPDAKERKQITRIKKIFQDYTKSGGLKKNFFAHLNMHEIPFRPGKVWTNSRVDKILSKSFTFSDMKSALDSVTITQRPSPTSSSATHTPRRVTRSRASYSIPRAPNARR